MALGLRATARPSAPAVASVRSAARQLACGRAERRTCARQHMMAISRLDWRVGHKEPLTRMAMSSTRTEYDVEQMRLLDADELILVDEADNVVGHESKKFAHLMENIAAGSALHRAFSVFLFNTDGKLLLQKRSDDKILFPNRWTNTCCSHPLYNSEEMDNPPSPDARGVRSATVRKLEHELGIPVGAVPGDSMHYMTRIVYKAAVGEDDKWGEHEVDYILLAVADVECNINPNEVSEIRYLDQDELPELLAQVRSALPPTHPPPGCPPRSALHLPSCPASCSRDLSPSLSLHLSLSLAPHSRARSTLCFPLSPSPALSRGRAYAVSCASTTPRY
jgi:isopentenyl-diphosphate delta-isomerase